ncbi:FACT complex subunit spt16 [Puccinia graminis f. sp. tritici]|uniref:FACT complex subunit n=2 Tax=Puccinia graminis f. sp. tritici TaxID=56615 RepID=E3K2C7_PUCGT|nr:uncharacterized protein PGTG_04452 [Puccinia graminis f. sp. tritici CRL 75-36-700-3]EFP78496.2 hypothetical protein PGTG_04452 [Puccinia graminis f. sp. tritici CRL 75-36-700-3]KAA1063735.1 FACT complex subunit spt16 [Puccinia graminis f. sp. tritici]
MWPHSRLRTPLDVDLVYSRLGFFIESWKAAKGPDTEKLQSCGGILMGEVPTRAGNKPLHDFLFGDRLIETLIFITPTTITFICSPRQAEVLAPLAKPRQDQSKHICVKLLVKLAEPKSGNSWMKDLLTSVEAVISNSKKIGRMSKDQSWAGWRSFLKSEGKGALYEDATIISNEMSAILAIKHPEEIKRTEIACQMSLQLMSLLSKHLISLIEEGEEITSQKIAQFIREKHNDGSYWEEAKFEPDFNKQDAILRSLPVIRAGGDSWRFRKSDPIGAEQLGNTGVFLADLGIQYKSYGSYIRRSLLVDPHPTQQENYSYLLELHRFALTELREGVTGHEFYALVSRKAKSDRPGLHLPHIFGSSLGADPQKRLLNLTKNCSAVLKRNMVFTLSLGFLNITDPFDRRSKYSLHITDTVCIGENGSIILSDGLREPSDITFFVNSDPSKTDQVKVEACSQNSKKVHSSRGREVVLKRSGSSGEERKRQKNSPAPSSNDSDCPGGDSNVGIDTKPRVSSEYSTAKKRAGLGHGDIQPMKNRGNEQKSTRANKSETPDVDKRLDVLKQAEDSMMKGLTDLENKLNDSKSQIKENFAELRKSVATDSPTDHQQRMLKFQEEWTTENHQVFQEIGKLE